MEDWQCQFIPSSKHKCMRKNVSEAKRMKQQKLLEAENQISITFKHKHRWKVTVVIPDRYLPSLIFPQSSFCSAVVFKKYLLSPPSHLQC